LSATDRLTGATRRLKRVNVSNCIHSDSPHGFTPVLGDVVGDPLESLAAAFVHRTASGASIGGKAFASRGRANCCRVARFLH
jgi:hypothetical protein